MSSIENFSDLIEFAPDRVCYLCGRILVIDFFWNPFSVVRNNRLVAIFCCPLHRAHYGPLEYPCFG